MPSPFEAALGTYQGRIQPTGWAPAEGGYVFVLGHDLPGQTFRIAFGTDAVSVTQEGADVSSSKLVRLILHERAPASIPAGGGWTIEGLIDGAAEGGFTWAQTAGRERTRHDLAFDVSALSGEHDLTIRLRATGTGIAEAELPGIYIDAVQLTTSESLHPALFNRDPEPGDVEVPLDSAIVFDVVDLAGFGVSSNVFNVFVDGAAAIQAGVLVGSWETSGSSITALASGFRVSLVPSVPWESLSEHTVRVVALAERPFEIDETWTWTAADLTPPRLVSASAPGRSEVRLTFNEAIDAVTVADPANYAITVPLGVAAVTPVVTGAAVEGPGIVALALDRWQTPRVTYSVTVENVTDVLGNAVAAPYNVAQWIGFECPPAPGRKFSLYEMWRGTGFYATDTGDLRLFMDVLQELVDHWLCELDDYVIRVLDPDTADEVYVDRMLRDMGNPFKFEISLNDRRRLLRVLWSLMCQKGTADGIENAVRTLTGMDVTVVPVVVGGPGLGAGKLSVDLYLSSRAVAKQLSYDIHSNSLLTDEQKTKIRRIAKVMQRGVCHLRQFVEPALPPPPAPLGLGAGRLSIDLYVR